MFRYRRDLKRIGIWLRMALLLLLALAVTLFADSQLRPVVKTMAAYQAKVYATEAINTAVTDYLAGYATGGGSIVTVTYGPGGEVSTIQTDMVALNNLKAGITGAVSDAVVSLEEQTMHIPIGTLLGGQMFSGRGPKVSFKILPSGYAQTDIVNKFDQAGINQTRHQIYVEIYVSIVAIVPGYTSSTEVVTSICVAETVIVGAVPETFAEFYLGDGTNFSGFDIAGRS